MSEEVKFIGTVVGTVTPPADMMAAARASLSQAGFDRLMSITGGAAPTPAQLVREADFERQGFYSAPEMTANKLQQIQQDAFMIAAARLELSDDAFKKLMHSIDWRAPTAAEFVEAVERERSSTN